MSCIYTWILQLAGLVLVFAFYLYWKVTRGLDYWQKKGAKYLEPTPGFGNIKDLLLMRKNDGHVYKELYDKLDGHSYGGIYQINKPALLIRDPELIRSVLVKDFAHFHDRGFRVDEKKDPLSGHLFFLAGQKWRKLRVKLTPTFTSGKMKSMFDILSNCAEQAITNMEGPARRKEEIEVKEVVARMTTDIIGSYAFGLELNTMKNPDSKFREFGRRIFRPSVITRINMVLARLFPIIGKVLSKFKKRDLEEFFMNAVHDTVKYREQNDIQRNDFLQLLIQLKNKGTIGSTTFSKEDEYLKTSAATEQNDSEDFILTDNLLAAQCFVFFLGGFETSSTTASYCLYELALNPDIQERLREEIDSVLSEYGGKITYEGIQKMKYLEQVIDETLRKFPAVQKLDRMCTIPYTIPGTNVVIDRGIPVIIPVYALHHDPKYFPNPDKFDPDRFSDENKKSRQQYTYIPFGEGPRICIGMRFGLLQTKVGITALLSKYKFSVSPKTMVPPVFDPKTPGMVIKGGTWLQISERSS